jgi:hypothetical protein
MNEIAQMFMDEFTEHIYSLRLLDQCRRFDPNNRTAYDGFMAFGYALLAWQDVVKKKEVEKVEKPMLRMYKVDINN